MCQRKPNRDVNLSKVSVLPLALSGDVKEYHKFPEVVRSWKGTLRIRMRTCMQTGAWTDAQRDARISKPLGLDSQDPLGLIQMRSPRRRKPRQHRGREGCRSQEHSRRTTELEVAW